MEGGGFKLVFVGRVDAPIEKVVPPKGVWRRSVVDEEEVGEVAANIRRVGLIHPLVVRRVLEEGEEFFEVVDGYVRLLAAREAGLREVPVRVYECDDVGAVMLALSSNALRSYSPYDLARMVGWLREGVGIKLEDVCKMMGFSMYRGFTYLELYRLVEGVRTVLGDRDAGRVVEWARPEHARVLMTHMRERAKSVGEDSAKREVVALALRAAKNGVTVKELEAALRPAVVEEVERVKRVEVKGEPERCPLCYSIISARRAAVIAGLRKKYEGVKLWDEAKEAFRG